MNLPAEFREDFEALPPALRALLEAELAAGNAVLEVGHSHPAPPVGAYFLLARPVTTRARASGNGLVFYERNSSSYSGEFTDAKRFHFILEAPLPPPPEPDMDAIRAEREARQRAADEQRQAEIAAEVQRARGRGANISHLRAGGAARAPAEADVVRRFRASMELDYERWREGTSYDLSLLAGLTPDDHRAIESLLVGRGVRDWRDVEALAALDTPRAREVLRETLARGSKEHATAVLRFAPHLVDERERTATIIAALAETNFYGGLTQALREVEAHHPPEVIDALLRGVLARDREGPVHFAAMLLYLHGKAASAFDWAQRPFLLQFNTPDRREREARFRELCARIGVDPAPYLAGR